MREWPIISQAFISNSHPQLLLALSVLVALSLYLFLLYKSKEMSREKNASSVNESSFHKTEPMKGNLFMQVEDENSVSFANDQRDSDDGDLEKALGSGKETRRRASDSSTGSLTLSSLEDEENGDENGRSFCARFGLKWSLVIVGGVLFVLVLFGCFSGRTYVVDRATGKEVEERMPWFVRLGIAHFLTPGFFGKRLQRWSWTERAGFSDTDAGRRLASEATEARGKAYDSPESAKDIAPFVKYAPSLLIISR